MSIRQYGKIIDDLPIKELLRGRELALLDFESDKIFVPNFDILDKFLSDYGFREVRLNGEERMDSEDIDGTCYDFFYTDHNADVLRVSGQLGIVAIPLNDLLLTQFGLIISRKAKVYAAKTGQEEEIDLYEFAIRHPDNIKTEYFSRSVLELMKRKQRSSEIYR